MNAFPILSTPLSHGAASPGTGSQECCRGGTPRPASGFLLLLWPPLQMPCQNHMVTWLRIFFCPESRYILICCQGFQDILMLPVQHGCEGVWTIPIELPVRHRDVRYIDKPTYRQLCIIPIGIWQNIDIDKISIRIWYIEHP